MPKIRSSSRASNLAEMRNMSPATGRSSRPFTSVEENRLPLDLVRQRSSRRSVPWELKNEIWPRWCTLATISPCAIDPSSPLAVATASVFFRERSAQSRSSRMLERHVARTRSPLSPHGSIQSSSSSFRRTNLPFCALTATVVSPRCGSSALDRAGRQPADDVLLHENEDQHHRDRGHDGERGQVAPFRSVLSQEIEHARRDRP